MLDRTRLAIVIASMLTLGCNKPPPEPPGEPSAQPPPTPTIVSPPPATALDIAQPAPDNAPDAVAAASPDATAGWIRLAPKGEGFAIEVPAEPLREVKPVGGPQGHTSELIQYAWSRDDLALVVSASPLVAQLVEYGNKDLALDRTLASQIEQPGRTVRYQKVTDQGDVLGREAEVDLAIEGIPARLRVRLYMQGQRIFQVLAMWQVIEGAPAVPPEVDRYFASFALTNDISAIAQPVDLWQAFPVPELGLSVELPNKPEVTTAESDTFLGKTSVMTMMSITSFPVSMFSIEVAAVPKALAAKTAEATDEATDKAILDLWKKARVAEYQGTPAPKVIADEATEFLGMTGRLLILRDQLPQGQTRDGHLRAVVERKDGKPTNVIIASAWAIDPEQLAAIAKRFYGSIKRTPSRRH